MMDDIFMLRKVNNVRLGWGPNNTHIFLDLRDIIQLSFYISQNKSIFLQYHTFKSIQIPLDRSKLKIFFCSAYMRTDT